MELIYIRVAVVTEVFVYWEMIIVCQLDTSIKKLIHPSTSCMMFFRLQSRLQDNFVSIKKSSDFR
jgi:hypothetical protein